MICDELPGHLKSICEGSHIRSDGSTLTPDERAILISKRLRRVVTADELPVSDLPHVPRQTKAERSRPKLSTIGTRIHSAIESADHYTNASGATRRFIAALNRPHKLTPDEITDRLADELSRPINTHAKRFVPVNRDWLAEIVTAAIADDAAERPVKQSAKVPSVSDVGTRIRQAIETEANYRMTCGSCIKFLQSLNETTEHDVNSIVTRLLTEIQIPTEFRKSIGDIEHQGYWLQGIVKRIIEGASHTES